MTHPSDPAVTTESATPTAAPSAAAPDETPAGGTRCGFIALVGAPNAGKSTLLNTMVGIKLSIVSPKVQTTRRRILGITIEGASQLLFVDTPGIFRPKRRLDRAMVAAAWRGIEDSELVVHLVDANQASLDEDSRGIAEQFAAQGQRAILALNKIDLIRRDRLLALTDELNRTGAYTDVFMISAVTGDGVGDLRRLLAGRVPAGPWLYPEDELTDLPMRQIAAERVREKLFLQLRQELPYATTVETEAWEEFKDGSVKISQVIFVERENQKAIVLGKGGTRIKDIGQAARIELEGFLGRRVHLKLYVKVREGWTEDPERYREMGLEADWS